MKKFLIITALLLSNLHAEESLTVPTDLEQNPDFQYVVKVLGIQDNEMARENLSIKWQYLKDLLAKIKPALENFEAIRTTAPTKLKTGVTDAAIGIGAAIFAGGIIEIGAGYHSRGLKIIPHLKMGWRGSTAFTVNGPSFGAALLILFRKYLVEEIDNGISTNRSYTAFFIGPFGRLTGDINNIPEKGLGVGLAYFEGKDKNHSITLSLPFGFKSPAGRKIHQLELLLRAIVHDLHRLDLADAYTKIDLFQIGVDELQKLLQSSWLDVNLPTKANPMHPLLSIRNLFEPSLYAHTIAEGCKDKLKSIAEPKTPKQIGR